MTCCVCVCVRARDCKDQLASCTTTVTHVTTQQVLRHRAPPSPLISVCTDTCAITHTHTHTLSLCSFLPGRPPVCSLFRKPHSVLTQLELCCAFICDCVSMRVRWTLVSRMRNPAMCRGANPHLSCGYMYVVGPGGVKAAAERRLIRRTWELRTLQHIK